MVLGERPRRGVHSLTSCSVWERPASRLAVRSLISCWGVKFAGARDSGRRAQTAATQGRPVSSRQR